jgi:hypothetical protein
MLVDYVHQEELSFWRSANKPAKNVSRLPQLLHCVQAFLVQCFRLFHDSQDFIFRDTVAQQAVTKM